MAQFPLATRPTVLLEQHCLNARHRQADCSRCEMVCPSQAIRLHGTAVMVDFERCTGCGLCLHTCPAEVFTTSRWHERTVLTNVVELDDAPVELFCACHPRPDVVQGRAGSLRIPTCLAAMSPGSWFELGLQRDVTVRLDACADCALNAAVEAITNAVELANDWLCDAGHDARITCVDRIEESAALSRRAVLDGAHRRTTRRGFFQSLFGPAKRELERDADVPATSWTGDDAPKKIPRLPAWMANAAQAYAQGARAERATPATAWPAVSISADCVACGCCTEYCPTGALELRDFDDYAITFLPGQCVDCRVCWASCPVGAITRTQSPTPEPFQRRDVYHEHVSACVQCGRPAVSEQSVCYWCAEEPPMVLVLSDARRWLLDVPLAKP